MLANDRKRSLWLAGWFALFADLSCQNAVTGPRQSCTGSGDASCPVSQTCIWLHATEGSGYFCGQLCTGDGACPSGQSCKVGAGSSCMTCRDVVDVCE